MRNPVSVFPFPPPPTVCCRLFTRKIVNDSFTVGITLLPSLGKLWQKNIPYASEITGQENSAKITRWHIPVKEYISDIDIERIKGHA